MKDVLPKTVLMKTEPNTSEEGVVSEKLTERNPESLEVEETLIGAASEEVVESHELTGKARVKDFEKNESADLEFSESVPNVHYEKPLSVSDQLSGGSKESKRTEECVMSGALEEQMESKYWESPTEADARAKREESTQNLITNTNSDVKVQIQSSTEAHFASANESGFDNRFKEDICKRSLTSTNSTSEAVEESFSSAASASDKADIEKDISKSDKSKPGKGEKTDSSVRDETGSMVGTHDVAEQTDDPIVTATPATKNQGVQAKLPPVHYQFTPDRKKLTPEQLDSVFVRETQEKLLGLTGAMLPMDSKVIMVSVW